MDELELGIEHPPQGFGFERAFSNDSISVDDAAAATDSDHDSKQAIGGKDAEGVMKRWKVIVAFMMLLTASTVIGSTYKFLTRAEEDQFLASVSPIYHRSIANLQSL